MVGARAARPGSTGRGGGRTGAVATPASGPGRGREEERPYGKGAFLPYRRPVRQLPPSDRLAEAAKDC